MTHAEDLPVSVCAGCGKPNDAGTSTSDRGIKPGDISVCLYCGHVSVLGWDYKLRPMTDQEMHDIAGDPRILKVQKLREEAMKELEPKWKKKKQR
jgi:hypothetical protein